ncbi:hypothetical protein GGR52DRAFT_554000 [Hypoxylon sp. FL1284]|nr:hypothetical protein GGR52DRAFT_554000 [Hypoxylon sp. FL1284]
MARKSKRATRPWSPRGPAPPKWIRETRIQRRIFRVPADQKKLLEGEDAWASGLKRRSRYFLNVPPAVLENIKACYSRQVGVAQSDGSVTSPEPQDHDQDQSGGPSNQDSPSAQSRTELKAEEEGEDEDEDEDEGEGDNDDSRTQPASWSSSPAEHMHPPRRTTSEDVENAEEENAREEEEDDDDQQPFKSQVPISSPRPTVPPKALPKAPFIFPPSSHEQEAPLDMEVPDAIHDAALSVNMPGDHLNKTPTSAQIIPCTLDQSVLPKPYRKQRIYNEPEAFYRPPKNEAALNHALDVKSEGKGGALHTDYQNSTPTTDISSSIIPATILPAVPGKDYPMWHTNPATFSGESHITGDKSHETQDPPSPRQPSPNYEPPRSPLLQSSPPIQQPRQTSPPIKARQISSSHEPFIRYKSVYPSYKGSLTDFVIACKYIRQQQNRRRIRPSLYDDFIRAWCEGYLPYVEEYDARIKERSTSEAPTEVLTAIDWYMESDEDQSFCSMVITKQNLQSTIDFYPGEQSPPSSDRGVPPNQILDAKRGRDAARPMKAHAVGDVTHVEEKLRKVANTLGPAAFETGSRTVPPTKPIVPRQRPDAGVLSLHKSMGEIEVAKKPAATREWVRSISEVAPQKRKASDDIGGIPPKRHSVNSLPPSDSRSILSFSSEYPMDSGRRGSVAPSSTSGRKKKRVKPEDRSTKLLEHFARRRQGKRDGSVMSLPASTTPTSGQRER